MKINKKSLILSSLAVLISALVIFSVVKAGSLTPPGSPAGTMNTLSDIYAKLNPTWQPTDPNESLCWSNGSADGDAGGEAEACSADGSGTGGSGSVLLLLPDGTTAVGAVEYCAYLNAAGTGFNCSGSPLACTALNAWRLPTEIELMHELGNEFLPGGNGGLTSNHFQENNNSYWSSAQDGSGGAFGGQVSSSAQTQSNDSAESSNGLVRCISNNVY